jgi:HTH-type transcriptional regulator / antitoxin HipB
MTHRDPFISKPVHSTADLGQRIRGFRRARGRTQVELAELSGSRARYLSELERGKDTAQIGKALETLRLLGLDIFIVPRSLSAQISRAIEEAGDARPG